MVVEFIYKKAMSAKVTETTKGETNNSPILFYFISLSFLFQIKFEIQLWAEGYRLTNERIIFLFGHSLHKHNSGQPLLQKRPNHRLLLYPGCRCKQQNNHQLLHCSCSGFMGFWAKVGSEVESSELLPSISSIFLCVSLSLSLPVYIYLYFSVYLIYLSTQDFLLSLHLLTFSV